MLYMQHETGFSNTDSYELVELVDDLLHTIVRFGCQGLLFFHYFFFTISGFQDVRPVACLCLVVSILFWLNNCHIAYQQITLLVNASHS